MTVVEPMLVSIMRRDPTGLVEIKPDGRPKTGTSTRGFLEEMATYENSVRADERRSIVADLRWLAEGREQYCHFAHDEKGNPVFEQWTKASLNEQMLCDEHRSADRLADMIEDLDYAACGWLPSWLWGKWTERGYKDVDGE